MSQAQTSAAASSSSSSSTTASANSNSNDNTNTLPSPTAELGLDDYDPTAPLTSQTLNADGTPKRPMNAFMIFARKRRPEISAADAALRTGEISKVLSREWAAMTAADKSYFQDQARKLKDHFNSKYPDYVYRRRPNHSRRRRRASSDQSHLGNGTGVGDEEGRSASAESEESPVDDHSPGGGSGTHSLSHHNSGQHGRMSSGSGGIYGPYPGSQAVSDILAPYRMPSAPTNGHGHGGASWNLSAATVDRSSDPSRGGSGRTSWPTVPPLSIGPSGGARYGPSSAATNGGMYGSYASSSASPGTYTPGAASSAQSQSAPSPAMSTLSAYSSAPAGGAGYGGPGNRASWSSQGSVPSPYDVRASSTSSGSGSNGPAASPYDMRPPSSASNSGSTQSPFDLRGPPAPASLYTLGTSHSSSYGGRDSGYASGRDAPPQSHSPPGGAPSYSLSRMGGYGGAYGGAGSGGAGGGSSTAQQHAQMAYQWGGRDVPLE